MVFNLKDTVTILKFLLFSDLFPNRRFWWDNAHSVNSLYLIHNCLAWTSLFRGQSPWVIPMTSSIDNSKRLLKIEKNIFFRNPLNFWKFWWLILFYIMNTSCDTCSIVPEHYRKVRKFSVDRNSIRHIFWRLHRSKFSVFRSEYY